MQNGLIGRPRNGYDCKEDHARAYQLTSANQMLRIRDVVGVLSPDDGEGNLLPIRSLALAMIQRWFQSVLAPVL